jgi:hypothetical protein
MNQAENHFPPSFADLETYYPEWCPPTELARAQKRVGSDIEALRVFQSALVPRMDAMVDYLNTQPNDPKALPEPARHLYWLAQMVMEASVPIDLRWKGSDIEDVYPLERMVFTTGVAGRTGF